MWSDFDKLRRTWIARPGGTGGIAAISGFAFQLASTLLAIVRSGQWNGPPSVFAEALSDIVSADDGYLIVTQAKLDLSSRTLRDALEEFLEIQELAEAETPQLASRLRYRVLASRATLRDSEAALARWAAAAETARDDLVKRVEISIAPEPRQELAVHLVNAFGVDDPFTRADRWLGGLMSDPSPDGLDRGCREIFTELAALEVYARERQHLFHIWSHADRPPEIPQFEADPNRAILTGQMPDRSHLAEGRFARRWFYETIHRDAEAWLEAPDHAHENQLSTYWISGRSGAGKSVALLHLLADLHRADNARIIIWLHQQAERLAEAVRWARPFFAEGKEVLFAADDPYTPERSQRVVAAVDQAQREIDSILVAYPHAQRPSMFLCGPTEQGQAFEDDLADRVRVRSFTLQPESNRDVEELKTWYSQRTGRTDLPIGTTDDVLIVQLFFEWATGQPIREFAQRFRRRLEGMRRRASSRSIFELIAEILALNRLYALFPTGAVDAELEQDPDLGRAFDRLRDEELHLTFDTEHSGLRLTHPHLANAIYVAWFGRNEDRRYRKKHLQAGIEGALAHGESLQQRFAPLWAISHLIAPRRGPEDSAQRVDLIRRELRELLTELYKRDFCSSLDPLGELPVWANLNGALDLQLAPAPLDIIARAVSNSNGDERGLRLSCHVLLRHRQTFPAAVSCVAQRLNADQYWIEWLPVATDYVSKVGISGIEDPLREVVSREWPRTVVRGLVWTILNMETGPSGRDIVLAWLQAAPPSERAWAGILSQLVDKTGLCETGLALGRRFLDSRPDDDSWSHIWERLYAHAPDERPVLASQAKQWLAAARPDTSGWDRVWEKLWAASGEEDEELRRVGERWLDQIHPDHGSWTFVWQALSRSCDESRERLLARGRRWLSEAQPEHPSWEYMWDDLLKASGGHDRDLLERARRWLDEVQPTNLSWAFAWSKLVEASEPGDEDLRAVGREWLDTVPFDHPSWRHVWKSLWRGEASEDEDLRLRGRRWLGELGLDHDLWPVVWFRLWDASGRSDQDLRARARQWLDEDTGSHPAWGAVWAKLWSAPGQEEEELRIRGREWLKEADVTHLTWTAVWKKVWPASDKADEMLLASGRRWLDGAAVDNLDWKLVWQGLWEASGKSDARLVTRARQWLEEAPAEHVAWRAMWQELWHASPRDDEPLRALGRKWLDEVSFDHPSWKYMWEDLREAPGSDDDDLVSLGRRWLEEAPPEHGSWKFMWHTLWTHTNGTDEELWAQGRRWLDRAPADHLSWKYMWEDLRQVPRSDLDNLIARGRQWLDEASPGHGSWKFMWDALRAEDGVDQADLYARGRKWLDEVPDHPSWRYMWEDLRRISPERGRELLNLGREWLHVARSSHIGWNQVWAAIWEDSDRCDEELWNLGREWIGRVPANPGWPAVWRYLWRAPSLNEEQRAELVVAASEWLELDRPISTGWPIVWHILWQNSDLDTDRLKAMATRLIAVAPPRDPEQIVRRMGAQRAARPSAQASSSQRR